MNACSERCAWCGRCEDDLHDTPPPRQYFFCDHCGKDAIYPVTLAGVGVACSYACMNQLEAKFAAVVGARRG